MEPTDPLTQEDGVWSDVEEVADDGVIEGFDDENWDSDAQKGDAVAVGKRQESENVDSTHVTSDPISTTDISGSVHADVKSPENVDVDNSDDAAANTGGSSAATDKWGLGTTLTAFAGALQQASHF